MVAPSWCVTWVASRSWARVRQVELTEGRNNGVRVAEFQTGTGFCFDVLLDRGMDIGACKYQGTALAWEASPGASHPAYYEPQGLGWLRSFHGGLIATCGLTYAGAPTVDEGKELGLHGRISNTPASAVWVDGAWHGDEYEMWALGRMRETVVFGENLTLTRRISARLGQSSLTVRDRVVNEGCSTSPFMMLYHCNFGFLWSARGQSYWHHQNPLSRVTLLQRRGSRTITVMKLQLMGMPNRCLR